MRRFGRVLAYFRPYLGWLMIGSVLTLLLSQMDTATALFARPMFDKIFVERDVTFLWIVPAFAFGLVIFRGVFGYLYGAFLGYVNARVTISIRNEIYENYLRGALSFFDHNPSGVLLSKLQYDAFNMQDSVSIVMNFFSRSLTFLGLVAVVFYRDWRLALVAIALVPLVGIPVSILGRLIRRLTTKSMESMGELNTSLHESLSGIRVVRAFGLESRRLRDFERQNERFFGFALRSAAFNLMTSPIIELITTIGVAAVLYYGGLQVIRGVITPGSLFSFVVAIGLIYDPVRNLSKVNNRLQVALASADRVFDTLDAMPVTPEAPDAKPLPPFSKSIEYSDVWFKYTDPEGGTSSDVLRGIDLVVKRGKIVAIVGSSGAGKTSLVNLLPRFYDVTSGAVKIDGAEINSVTLHSLRNQIAVVTQETYLFDDTIKANISYGVRRKVSDKDIFAAAKAANAHEFILSFPDGYDTVVGERGARLSGGQRQRVAIARAILKNAPILILDEATSSLDTEAEQEVQRALNTLMEGRTTLVIAHRLSTVRRADKIVVIEDGKIAESGRHDELIAADGVYKRLYELQFATEDADLLRPGNALHNNASVDTHKPKR